MMDQNAPEAYLEAGYTCSQAMVMANASSFGLSPEIACLMASGFAGGLFQGKTCGAVIGAVMISGLAFGSDRPKDAYTRDLCSLVTQDICQRFSRRHGSVECRCILKRHGVDMADPEQIRGLRASGLCTEVVRDAQAILMNLLAKRPS